MEPLCDLHRSNRRWAYSIILPLYSLDTEDIQMRASVQSNRIRRRSRPSLKWQELYVLRSHSLARELIRRHTTYWRSRRGIVHVIKGYVLYTILATVPGKTT
ncbi:hypothetical protein AcV5_010265 [Taiwanofungus camphoratus]|nr:hypothetical protein AcV5_010265 [Antrodia cinnamomea]